MEDKRKSNGSIEREERTSLREIIGQIIFYATLCLVVLVILRINIFTARQKEEKARFREQQEQIFLEQAETGAEEKVQAYANIMEDALQKDGLSDATVSWSEMSREKYESHYGRTGICYTDHRYYYKISYQSDEIAEIFEQHIQNGTEEELFLFMNQLLDAKQKHDFENGTVDHFDSFNLDGGSVAYFIVDEPWYWEVSFATSTGEAYRFERNGNGGELYQNENLIYQKPNTRSSGSFHSEISKPSGSSSYDDPYNVQDYTEGDVFADEWAEEFSDSYFGSYDNGYEDAYDYWEEYGY